MNFSHLKNFLDQNNENIQQVENYFHTNFESYSSSINNHNILDSEKIIDITNLKLYDLDFPLKINIDTIFANFYESSVLRPLDSKKLEKVFLVHFFKPNTKSLFKHLFLIVLIKKFPNCIALEKNTTLSQPQIEEEGLTSNTILEESPNIKKKHRNEYEIRKEISKFYSNLFIDLPQPKEELINYHIFSIGYMIHMQFFMNFPLNRNIFKLRFIFDVYITIIYELHGIFVSDYYVQTMIEKIFTTKFLDYEKNLTNETLISKRKSIQNIHNDSQCDFLTINDGNNNIIANPISHSVTGGVTLTQQKSNFASFFSHLKSQPHQPNRLREVEIFSNELNFKLKPKNPTKNKIKNEEELKTIEEDNDKKIGDNNNKEESYKLRRSISLYEKNDNLMKKMKFNCVGISPAIGNILDLKQMHLPMKKNKLINYSLDKLYGQQVNYKQMFENFNREYKTNLKLRIFTLN